MKKKRKISELKNWDKKLYDVWYRMKTVCSDKNHKDFGWYGGKGIIVCDEWVNDVNVFREWALTNGYKPGLTIDRINGNGNYEPNNCQWVTIQENLAHRSHLVTKDGLRKCENCGEIKPLLEFHKNKENRHYHCKVCRSIERRLPNGYYARRERENNSQAQGFI